MAQDRSQRYMDDTPDIPLTKKPTGKGTVKGKPVKGDKPRRPGEQRRPA